MVAQYDLELEHMDIKTAFLHDNLEEKIVLMEKSESFLIKGLEDHVCLLIRNHCMV